LGWIAKNAAGQLARRNDSKYNALLHFSGHPCLLNRQPLSPPFSDDCAIYGVYRIGEDADIRPKGALPRWAVQTRPDKRHGR
jgi:hypothetical protein